MQEKRQRHGQQAAGTGAGVPLTISRPELVVDGSDRHFRRFIHALFAVFARCEVVRNNYAEHVGLPGPQYSILLCIRHLSADGPVNVKTVATHLRLSGSFITSETRKLEELGLLTKVRDPKDRRQTRLVVTKKGGDLLDRLAPMQRQVNDVQFACLSREQFLELIPLMEELIDCCDRAIALQRYMKLGGQDSPGRTGGRGRAKSEPSKALI